MSAIQLTLSEAETAVWNRIIDNDAAGHRLSQTVLDALLNRAYCLVKGIRDDRPKDMAANATGLSFSPGDTIKTLSLATNVRHILNAWITESSTTTTFVSPATSLPTPALERWTRAEIIRMRVEEPDAGEPSAVAFWRNGTATASDVGKWSCALWRIPDTIYYVAIQAIVDPTALASASDKFDVDPDVSQAIVDMTAALGARLIGRPELSDAIQADVPKVFTTALQQMESDFFGKSGRPAEVSG